MLRFRAFLAILLATLWCSMVWHADLEALGWMVDHDHRHHHHHGAVHHSAEEHQAPQGVPGTVDDHHDPVYARDVTETGQLRLGATGVLWFFLLGGLGALALSFSGVANERDRIRGVGQTGPPYAKVWQFLRRCASEAAAPPALS